MSVSGSRLRFASVCAVVSALIGASVVSLPSVAYADVELPVELGAAGTYAVLSGASIGNTVSAPGAPHTVVRGDLGVSGSGAASSSQGSGIES